MPRKITMISGDSHLDFSPERWTHRVPQKWRDRAPRQIKLRPSAVNLLAGSACTLDRLRGFALGGAAGLPLGGDRGFVGLAGADVGLDLLELAAQIADSIDATGQLLGLRGRGLDLGGQRLDARDKIREGAGGAVGQRRADPALLGDRWGNCGAAKMRGMGVGGDRSARRRPADKFPYPQRLLAHKHSPDAVLLS